MTLLIGSLQLGLLYAVMVMGIYISFRILNVPDLTAEGSFTFGLAVSALLASHGHPLLALLLAVAAGALSGMITGFLQTKLAIHPVLAGILTMSGLYSINMLVLGGTPNLTLLGKGTLFTILQPVLQNIGLSKEAGRLLISAVFAAGSALLLAAFFRTQSGLCIRATGDNEAMVRASSINVDAEKMAALALSNALIALCGGLIAQYQSFADINSGVGILVVGLASVIIGEALFGRRSVDIGFLSCIAGSVIYRYIIALVTKSSWFPSYMLKFASAVIVAVALALPALRAYLKTTQARRMRSNPTANEPADKLESLAEETRLLHESEQIAEVSALYTGEDPEEWAHASLSPGYDAEIETLATLTASEKPKQTRDQPSDSVTATAIAADPAEACGLVSDKAAAKTKESNAAAHAAEKSTEKTVEKAAKASRPMLAISHAYKCFAKGTANEKQALSDFSLSLQPGDFVTVLGSNGAGKSTLFNAICGNFLLDDGTVTLDGRDLTFLPEYKRAKRIGRLFQDPMKGTAPSLTIAENLALAYSKQKKHSLSPAFSKQERALFREKLAAFHMGLEERMDTKVGLLSGGQRQVVTLLMATLIPPSLLLLDEHTAALDPATARKVMDITNRIVAENHITSMMITHNMDQALVTGNRTIMLENGALLFDIGKKERSGMTADTLVSMYASRTGQSLANDRMRLKRQE